MVGLIETVPATGSTNADLLARLAFGETIADGFWLMADRQSAGRGRQGRAWADGIGNFMGSTVVRILLGEPPAPTLALLAGVAVHRAVSQWLDETSALQLKWPNDLLLHNAKLAGILLEAQGSNVVIGIGVNLVAAPKLDDRATIALCRYAPSVTRDDFANQLAAELAALLLRWRGEGIGWLIAEWEARAHPRGTPLRLSDGSAEGGFDGLSPDGALMLRLADGTRRAIYSGEIIANGV